MRRSTSFVVAISFLIGQAAAQDVMSVEGAQLLRNDAPFEIHGVQLMAFSAPIEYMRDPPAEGCARDKVPPCPLRAYVRAYEAFGEGLLTKAKEFGANTILFKVSEPGMDPENPLYSEGYIDDVVRGVRLARDQGFIVILTLRSNRVGGAAAPKGARQPIPRDGTLRAAKKLAETFGSDQAVMIELYAEPFGRGRSREFWNYYINGGDGYVGINTIIQSMRDAGAKNVLIVEALGQDFSRYPGGFADPLGQLAYAVHGYFNMVGTTRDEWDRRYGVFAETHPLIITEWSESTNMPGTHERRRGLWCERAPLDTPLQAVHYMKEKGIDGIVGWSFDLPQTFVQDLKGTARTLSGFECGQAGGGIGDLFQQYFRNTLPPLPGELN